MEDNCAKWGIPKHMISLWSGESGVGKSRLAVKLAKVVTKAGCRVLYVQNELPIKYTAGGIKKDLINPQKFICSTASSIHDIIEDIRREYPSIVIIDSVNEIDEFETGTKKEARLIINALREVACLYLCHVILLGQLNQNGTIKGGTSLPHLVDIAIDLEKYGKDYFIMRAGIKNRCGRVGGDVGSYWKHTRDSVECVQCDYDDVWNSTHVAPKEMVALTKTFWSVLLGRK
jgi:predicted ATP-dependent serine protease